MSDNVAPFTSTGRIGLDLEASHDRVRRVEPTFVSDPRDLDAMFEQLLVYRDSGGRSRSVLQAVVARGHQFGPSCIGHIESYTPLGPGHALVTVAANSPARRCPHALDMMLCEVDASVRRVTSCPVTQAEAHMEPAGDGLFSIVHDATLSDVPQLERLWGKTFGWTPVQIRTFIEDLAKQEGRAPENRELWFVGARDVNGRLVSAAQAERLDLEGPDGRRIPIVESTEWATLHEARGHGLMSRSVAYLNARVLSDLGHVTPHIFAECNFDVRAHRIGLRAFMRVTDCRVDGLFVPQIHRQNVAVYGELKSFVRTVLEPTPATLQAAQMMVRGRQLAV